MLPRHGRTTLDEQIAGYEAADDAYFRARSADLRDIRDRVHRALTGERGTRLPPGAVLHAQDLTPSEFLSMDWKKGGGIVLREGSAASHVAMLARSRGVPMLVSTPTRCRQRRFRPGRRRARRGHGAARRGRARRLPRGRDRACRGAEPRRANRLGKPAVTVDGIPVEVLVNIAEPVGHRTASTSQLATASA